MGYKKVTISEDAPLRKARELTMVMAEDGCLCPVCNRLVRIYKRPLHAEMALFLVKLVRKYQQDPKWYSTEEILAGDNHLKVGGTNGSLLIHWELIERSDNTNRGNAPCGLYRPTLSGIDFVYMKRREPSHVHLRNNIREGASDKKVYITEALGKKFDYQTLMRK